MAPEPLPRAALSSTRFDTAALFRRSLTMLYLSTTLVGALVLPGGVRPGGASRVAALRMQDTAFGASHTSFYTDAKKQDKYFTLEEVLADKMADKDLSSVRAEIDPNGADAAPSQTGVGCGPA
eukprot:5122565-Prymnesium_polylepis.1